MLRVQLIDRIPPLIKDRAEPNHQQAHNAQNRSFESPAPRLGLLRRSFDPAAPSLDLRRRSGGRMDHHGSSDEIVKRALLAVEEKNDHFAPDPNLLNRNQKVRM